MNRRDAIKTIGSLASLATATRVLPGCFGGRSSVAPTDGSTGMISSDAWGTSWTHVVPGRWTTSGYDGVLLYDQTSGTASFHDTDGSGARVLPALKTDTSWRTTWTIVASGFFTSSQFSCVLLYDQAAGLLAIYGTDGAGNLTHAPVMQRHTRTTWTHIVPGWFVDGPPHGGETFSSILLYSQSEGHAEVWRSDGRALATARTFSDWRTSWTKIVAGSFGSHPDSHHARSDLFFYEGATGYAEHWGADGTGTFSFVRGLGGLPTNVSDVLAGNFGSGVRVADIALFGGDGIPAGQLSFHRLPIFPGETGLVAFDGPATSLSATTSIVVAGNFYMADPDDHWFHTGPLVTRPTTAQHQAIQNWRGSLGTFKSFIAYDRTAGVAACLLHDPAPDTSAALEGYASSTTNIAGQTVSTGSVLPGETISFCVSSGVGAYTMDIHALTPTGLSTTPLATLSGLPPSPTPLYRSRLAYRDGAGWAPVASFTVPASWSSGMYVAVVTAASSSLEIPFVVRAASPGANKILVVIPDATYEAYNLWGGRSLYGFLATSGTVGWAAPGAAPPGAYGPYAFKVSFDRAYHPSDPDPTISPTWRKWLTFEAQLAQWLQWQQLGADYCTSRDLDRAVPSSAYKAVVFPGHHEYWSAAMRDNLHAYNDAGGNSVFLTGNTCWFQVRFDYATNQMVCYKVAEFDPVFSTSSSAYTTTNWHLSPVNRASSTTTGLMWSGHLTADVDATQLGIYEYQIRADQQSHPVFRGLGLLQFGTYFADSVGFNRSVANGAELDAMVNSCFVGNHPAPADLVPLADVLMPCEHGPPSGAATMCMFAPSAKSAARAFNAATYRWVQGLSTPRADGSSRWTAMDQITRNVFDLFLAG